jgi:RNA-directed DNA polymerase
MPSIRPPPLHRKSSVSAERHPLFRQRGYAHFDRPVAPDRAIAYCVDPECVARHAFWPFLRFTKTTPRYVRDPDTKKRHRGQPKQRELCSAAHMDSHIYSKYASDLTTMLDQHYRRPFGASVLAYRQLSPPRNNVDFAVAAFREIAHAGDCDVIALDLKDFFGSLDHGVLKARWLGILGTGRTLPRDHFAIYRAITRYSWIDRGSVRNLLGRDVPRRRGRAGARVCSPEEFRSMLRPHVQCNRSAAGIPQGSPISAVLANLYMLAGDESLHEQLGEFGASYRRYSDDILVVCPPGYARQAEATVISAVEGVKLTVQESKTIRVAFRSTAGRQTGLGLSTEGQVLDKSPVSLQYLGLAWDGNAIRLRQATVAGFIAKMVHGVRSAESAARRNRIDRIFRRKLYRKFSFMGRSARTFGPQDPKRARNRNFIHYGRDAALAAESMPLRKQVGALWVRLNREIRAAEERLRREL